MNNKRTVQFLLIDGTANGRIRAQLDNWTGLAYRIPKQLLAESRERKDLHYCGVYFLFGSDEETGDDLLYIGQTSERKNGDSLLARFAEHSRNPNKNFCREVVFFTTMTDDFGPTELCYLENRFWNLAAGVGRYKLVNGNEPSIGNVTEAKQVELDRYISNAHILMRALGFLVFEPKNSSNVPAMKDEHYFLDLQLRSGLTVSAEGRRTTEGFVVLKGSEVLQGQHAGLLASVKERRKKLVAAGILVLKRQGVYELKDDQVFSSPSTAGSLVYGGSINGRTAWKRKDGRTLADVENKS